MNNHRRKPMRLMKRIRRWLGVEELNWWDREDAGPVATLQGAPLAAALRHYRRAGA